MKYFLTLILALFLNPLMFAEAELEQATEEAVEETSASDDDNGVLISADDFSAESLQPYLVWGVGIALLSSVSSDSGTGTATTD